ncbi:hypothetical protein [Polluticaenibacter yanchengensis]|uniref:Transcriptional regulator n=1 Tax=Polluticaenibacter yanchengensis TaxID=3014562 RepID=A0ABT4UNS2_9BACT|nr:hypothetical protein [Chitinophagaceae bacterium LY-5]
METAAVITGDIINSQKVPGTLWLPVLKAELNHIGKSPKDWQIYRGDSFQFICDAKDALLNSFFLKAALKNIAPLDARLAIGIGTVEHRAAKITESNGPAFVHSGHCFDQLKKQRLSILTPWPEFNQTMHVMLALANTLIDKWTEKSSETIYIKLKNPALNQQEIANLLNKKGQGNISEALKRGGIDELTSLLVYYQNQIDQYVRTGS